MDPALAAAAGGPTLLLLGNEAIVRGALEARVAHVSGYPGTPATEIGDTFARIRAVHRAAAPDAFRASETGSAAGFSFEWSINEKIALEVAYGASLAGVRSLVAMKHLGLLYAGDPLSTMPYIGVVGGMVIVSASDPGCHTSPNEQDQRHLARMLGLPTLDPSTPEEARVMTRFAFELSEAAELPVLVRIAARVAHACGQVETEAFVPARPAARFVRQPTRFIPVPMHARRLRARLEERLVVAGERIAESGCVVRHDRPGSRGNGAARSGPRRGVVTSGAPHVVAVDGLAALGIGDEVPWLRVGALHPLPERALVEFARELDEVLVIEDLTPFLEDALAAALQRHGLAVRILGKRSGTLPWAGELGPELLVPALGTFLGIGAERAREVASGAQPGPVAPPRPPSLCPGCPHTSTFVAVRRAFGGDTVYVSDIGCYTLGFQPPHEVGDVILAMGSSLPIASGIARATGRRAVAFMGDSTFFHSGLPALANAVEHDANVVLVVMDNQATAMTGQQTSPTSPHDHAGETRPHMSILEAVRGLGVSQVEVVDPFELATTVGALGRARDARGPAVVIAERACPYYGATPARPKALAPHVDAEHCHSCGMRRAGLDCGLGESAAWDRTLYGTRAENRALVDQLLGGPVAVAPCAEACPLGICVQAYVGSIASGSPKEALSAVTARAALPSICSHICHRPCEDACVRHAVDMPIAINELKRHLTDGAGLVVEHPPCAPIAPGSRPVAIVGAGPAGLAAARELRRRGHSVVLYDAAARAGGALRLIPEYRLPRAVLERDLEALFALGGIELRGGVRVGTDVSLAELRAQGFAAILLATGAGRAWLPEVARRPDDAVGDALAFLAEDPAPLSGPVVVVGGGDVAVDAARVAVRRGAAVTLSALERAGELPADPGAVASAEREGVAVRTGLGVLGLERRGGELVVRLAPVLGLTAGPEGGLVPELGAEVEELHAARVLFATGQRPDDTGLELGALARRSGGWLVGDDCGRTAEPDLFVAGDVALGAANVTRAMASGVRAAYAIDRAVRGDAVEPPTAPRDAPRAHGPRRHARAAASEGGPPLGPEAAMAEAARCLLCAECGRCDACVRVVGCPAFVRTSGHANDIDAALCIACGYCVSHCPNEAVIGLDGPPLALGARGPAAAP
ncbi:MAG: FAD-dependent oxidoreductase [Polyangiaceae bacterium]|nr:FAD-dependent oxidoreductase [Polyangiaceae bacterium]